MGTTDHYGLARLGAGESFHEDAYKFTDADRALIDRLLYLGAEGHRHGAAAASDETPGTLSVTLDTSAGSLPSGTRIYYKYTLVDVNGFETAPSAEVYIDTLTPVVEPSAPVLNVSTTGGALLPGQYYYVLSAYTGITTNETKALNPSYVTVPVGTSTNAISLTLPTRPAGATGFNVYRKKPGGSRYDYLASTTSTTTYVDNGSVAEDCNRVVPTRNSTNATNAGVASIGTVPVGYTWKLYRTYNTGFYDNSLLHHVVEETFEGSGIVTGTYVDLGLATVGGKPPASTQVIGGPAAIELTDAVDLQGRLPMGAVSAFPFVVTFHFPGPLSVINGSSLFVIEYPQATIVSVRASLGRGYAPAATDVIVDVEYLASMATPSWTTIFTNQATRPVVEVGSTIGDSTVPQITEFVAGNALAVNIEQVGGGATPTDRDLTVNILMYAYGWGLTSHPWAGA